MSALLESGKPPTTRVRRRISLFNRSIMLFYSSRLSFSCGGVGKPPFSRAGRAGGLTHGATMARLGPRYGSGRLSLRATSSRVEGDGLAGTGAAPMVSFPVCAPRSFFVLVRNNPSLRIASASQRIPVGPARRFPLPPSDERHTNAYLNLGTLPTPLPRFLGTFLSTETTSQVRTMPSTKHPHRHIRQHITFAR